MKHHKCQQQGWVRVFKVAFKYTKGILSKYINIKMTFQKHCKLFQAQAVKRSYKLRLQERKMSPRWMSEPQENPERSFLEKTQEAERQQENNIKSKTPGELTETAPHTSEPSAWQRWGRKCLSPLWQCGSPVQLLHTCLASRTARLCWKIKETLSCTIVPKLSIL